jgi:hypothetical protein
MLVERNGKRDDCQAQQKMDELCALEIRRIGRSDYDQQCIDGPDRVQHWIGERMAPGPRGHTIRHQIGDERGREPMTHRGRTAAIGMFRFDNAIALAAGALSFLRGGKPPPNRSVELITELLHQSVTDPSSKPS